MNPRIRAPVVAYYLVALAIVVPVAAQSNPQPWTMPVDDERLPAGPDSRHFRVTVDVRVPGIPNAREMPVQAVLDLGDILARHGHPAEQVSGRWVLQGFELDPNTFVVHEVDDAGAFLRRLAVSVIQGSVVDPTAFDPQVNPSVTLRWIMPGTTTGLRQFHIYFDSVQNGPAPSSALGRAEEVQLATSVGPGPGTTLFIPLQPIRSAQLGAETRRVVVTGLYDNTDVSFHEYRAGMPNAEPTTTILGVDAGQTAQYVLGANGHQVSEGSVLVRATRPIVAEALSVPPNLLGSFVANGFIPAAEGGFLGKTFVSKPTAPQTWHAFCPKASAAILADAERGCTLSANGQEQAVPANGEARLTVAAGQSMLVQVSAGLMAIQRQGVGLAYWPPLDGPAGATQFLGYAGEGDHLLFTASVPETCLLVDSQGKFLADRGSGRLCLPEGAFRDCQCPWGTTTLRGWETEKRHTAGPLRVETTSGSGLAVWSGPIDHPTNFNNLAVPQSPDGGLTYRIYIPAGTNGAAIGSIALFALQDGTEGVATNEESGEHIGISTLREGERFDLRDAGWWNIVMGRPVVAAWLKTGAGAMHPFGSYAPGFTDVAAVEVRRADFAGYAFEVEVRGQSFLQRQPGDLAQFALDISNLARDTAGIGLSDELTVHLEAPEGWTTSPTSSHLLGAGGSATVHVQANIPQAPSGAGATLRAIVTSTGNPNLHVEVVLQVSFVIRRGVEIIEVNGANPDQAERNVGLGETASYTLRVTNKGSAPDSFDVLYSPPPERWSQAATARYEGSAARTPELPAGGHADIVLDVTPGPEVTLASKLVTRISATSLADSSVTDSLRAITVVGADRSFRVLVDAPTRTVDPGQKTTFNLTIVNDAQVNEELRIELTSSLPAGWVPAEVRWVEEDATLEEVGNTIRIDAGGKATISVTRAVPLGAAPLALAVDRLRMQSQFDRDATASDTALRVLAGALHGVQAEASGPARPIDPSEDIEFTVNLVSLGNVNQTLRVTPAPPSSSWNATTPSGTNPPWDVPLPPDARVSLVVRLHVPADAAPGKAAYGLSIGGVGIPTAVLNLTFDVKERPAALLESGSARLDPGSLLQLDVPIHNVGNVPIRVDGRWTGLPDWDLVSEGIQLVPGASGFLRTRFQTPPAAPALLNASLEAVVGGTTLARSVWTFVASGPMLEGNVQRVQALGGDRMAYTVLVTNTGTHAAHNVSVLLEAEGSTHDRFAISEVLPGAKLTAVVLAPTDAQEVRLRLTADHDPVGIVLATNQETASGGYAISTLALAGLLAALLLATKWRRA